MGDRVVLFEGAVFLFLVKNRFSMPVSAAEKTLTAGLGVTMTGRRYCCLGCPECRTNWRFRRRASAFGSGDRGTRLSSNVRISYIDWLSGRDVFAFDMVGGS